MKNKLLINSKNVSNNTVANIETRDAALWVHDLPLDADQFKTIAAFLGFDARVHSGPRRAPWRHVARNEKEVHDLAVVGVYKGLLGQIPAEADIQCHFRIGPPQPMQFAVSNTTAKSADRGARPEPSTSSSFARSCQSLIGSSRPR